MIVIGLTGSIGMGKTTTADMFRAAGVPVQDADQIVHQLMARGGIAVPRIEGCFPGVISDGAVDRRRLGDIVFNDPAKLKQLENILHPLVAEARGRFLRHCAMRGCFAVVLDIPLLFETKGERACDLTVLVTAPHFVQAARVLRRAGMKHERLAAIRAKQMPDQAKRRLADIIVQTGLGRRPVQGQVNRLLRSLRAAPGGRIWPPVAGRYKPTIARPAVLESLRKPV